jgi:hypothetical protein
VPHPPVGQQRRSQQPPVSGATTRSRRATSATGRLPVAQCFPDSNHDPFIGSRNRCRRQCIHSHFSLPLHRSRMAGFSPYHTHC